MKGFWRKLKIAFNTKVLLCDLDGTLIETKSGETFPVDTNDWKFKPWIQEAIQEYDPGYIFIISNQGGIAEGYVDEREFWCKFRKIIDEVRTWGDFVVDGTYCSSNDKDNINRKPNTGMVDFFREDCIRGYDFARKDALMIGDASGLVGQHGDSDLQCAINAGVRYCDVNHFIHAMVPCSVCDELDLPCGAGDDYPELPCSDSKMYRLRKAIIK